MACYYFVGSSEWGKIKKYYTVSSILVPNFDIIRVNESLNSTVVIPADHGTVPVKLLTIHPTEEDANNKIQELIFIDKSNDVLMDENTPETNEKIIELTQKVQDLEKEIKRQNDLIYNIMADIEVLKLTSNDTNHGADYIFVPNTDLKFLRSSVNKTLNDIRVCEEQWEVAMQNFKAKLEKKIIPVSARGPRLSVVPLEGILKSYSLWPIENKHSPATWSEIPKTLRDNITKVAYFFAEQSITDESCRIEQINKRTRDWVGSIQEKFRSRKKYLSGRKSENCIAYENINSDESYEQKLNLTSNF